VATREELKTEIERLVVERGHTPGPWLDVGHAAQLGCLTCEQFAFVELLPPPGKVHMDRLAADCPSPRIETPIG
jgi:hypothetical protein